MRLRKVKKREEEKRRWTSVNTGMAWMNVSSPIVTRTHTHIVVFCCVLLSRLCVLSFEHTSDLSMCLWNSSASVCVSACMCAFMLQKFQTNEWNQTLIVFLCLLWVCWLTAANTIAFQYKRTTNTVGRCQYKLMLTHTCIVSPKSNKTRLMKSWNLKSLYRVYHVGTHIRTHSHRHWAPSSHSITTEPRHSRKCVETQTTTLDTSLFLSIFFD